MTESTPEPTAAPAPPAAAPAPPSPYGAPPAPYGAPPAPAYGNTVPTSPPTGELGQLRSTGTCILLAIVTLGIYSLVWTYKVHEEMKRHSGQGIGGVLALVLSLVVGVIVPFMTSNEVAALDKRAGRPEKVSALTGLWYFPGVFILIGPIIWFVKTNGALNDYWKSQGATA